MKLWRRIFPRIIQDPTSYICLFEIWLTFYQILESLSTLIWYGEVHSRNIISHFSLTYQTSHFVKYGNCHGGNSFTCRTQLISMPIKSVHEDSVGSPLGFSIGLIFDSYVSIVDQAFASDSLKLALFYCQWLNRRFVWLNAFTFEAKGYQKNLNLLECSSLVDFDSQDFSKHLSMKKSLQLLQQYYGRSISCGCRLYHFRCSYPIGQWYLQLLAKIALNHCFSKTLRCHPNLHIT